jgi:hypothetical protein
LPEEKRFMNLVSSIGVYGLDTSFRGREKAGPSDIKVYRNGEYVASCHYFEDAAALAGMTVSCFVSAHHIAEYMIMATMIRISNTSDITKQHDSSSCCCG